MKTRLAVLAVIFPWLAASVSAHPLDEYLQATMVAVGNDRIALQLHLTPGAAVARKVLAVVDTDGDGAISDAEQQAYAERVRGDLAANLDGTPLSLHLTSSVFPTAEEFAKGSDIWLQFEADLPAGESAHRLTLENRHQSAIAVYLVNCLVPRDPNVRIVAQDRNYTQSRYQLDFMLGDPIPDAQTPASSPSVPEPPTDSLSVMTTYFVHGVHHILTGYDHLLFASALVLAAASLWDLVKLVTAFTLAHSITLTLAALNLVHVPGYIVESLIAASIIFVAIQNVFWPVSSRGRGRLAAAFFFGLFHGLGFAGGLLELMHDMPRETVLLAILGFSIGVETGHQIVILPLFGFLKAARHTQRDAIKRTHLSMALQRIGSSVVLVAGLYYLCVALSGTS